MITILLYVVYYWNFILVMCHFRSYWRQQVMLCLIGWISIMARKSQTIRFLTICQNCLKINFIRTWPLSTYSVLLSGFLRICTVYLILLSFTAFSKGPDRPFWCVLQNCCSYWKFTQWTWLINYVLLIVMHSDYCLENQDGVLVVHRNFFYLIMWQHLIHWFEN